MALRATVHSDLGLYCPDLVSFLDGQERLRLLNNTLVVVTSWRALNVEFNGSLELDPKQVATDGAKGARSTAVSRIMCAGDLSDHMQSARVRRRQNVVRQGLHEPEVDPGPCRNEDWLRDASFRNYSQMRPESGTCQSGFNLSLATGFLALQRPGGLHCGLEVDRIDTQRFDQPYLEVERGLPILLEAIGTQALLYGLIVVSILGAAVTWMYRIETTGVNLDRLEQQ